MDVHQDVRALKHEARVEVNQNLAAAVEAPQIDHEVDQVRNQLIQLNSQLLITVSSQPARSPAVDLHQMHRDAAEAVQNLALSPSLAAAQNHEAALAALRNRQHPIRYLFHNLLSVSLLA